MVLTIAKLRVTAGVTLAMALAFPPASAATWAIAVAPAQAEPHSKAESGESVRPPGEAQAPAGQEAGEKKTEKKEDATEALTESLRHSPAVKAIARLTGLDAEKAYWLSTVLNFLIVAVVLWVLLRKMLPAAFRNRTEAIQKRLEEARRASEEARQRLSVVEQRLARLDAEITQMRSEADATVKADAERVMKAAEDERRRIVEASQQEIVMAASAAQRELKAFVADLAVGLAEKKIVVSAAADQALVRDFAGRLGKEQ
jgi:F-type H+-transporting ATPase subunit b